ncbi:hypothetical protein MKW94_021398 [Papaver nudicaule]|uniref:3'-5' exonuclease domain-containing protein n=1 Tax=Papaver nudicaule TaxID=74823 RepID=A0AA41UXF4_PAPNU|nr:hypothetical protein [Papaver nudicaule]
MAGSQVRQVQNDLAGLSLSTNGDAKVSSIEVVDKTKSDHHVYNVYYYKEKIRTTVTHKASVVDQWIVSVYNDFRHKLNNLVVGLDIEWSRIRDNSERNKVAVLQLCLARRCLIFQISCCDSIPKSLHEFLNNNEFIFAGVGIDSDAYKLWGDHRLNVSITEELGGLAAFKLSKTVGEYREGRLCKAGLKVLAKDVLNLELPKPEGILLSNWNIPFLSDYQVEYACLDALVSYKLAIDLMNRANPVHTDEPKKSCEDYLLETEQEDFEMVNESKTDGTKSDSGCTQKPRDTPKKGSPAGEGWSWKSLFRK